METEIRNMYYAEMREVHSGDDIVLLVDLGVDSLYKRVRVRLSGVDTPDAHKAPPSSPAGIVRERVKSLLSRKKCRIDVLRQNRGSWVVVLYVLGEGGEEDINLNELLTGQGFVFKKAKE